ncbi:MAG: FCD domain-containing protein [Rhodobacter sp.]|nr:FCD domain-containing protein [Rhodobacter sp.]
MSDQTLTKLRRWLSVSDYPDGTRLPAERQLAEDLAVSRAELRKALLVLEIEGRLARKVGRGTYLTRPAVHGGGVVGIEALAALAERTSPHEAMIARLALEPQLAHLAALHATPRQVSKARRLAEGMRAAIDWAEYEALDSQFHDLIAESANNALLHELHRIVNSVRQAVVWVRLSLPADGPPPAYHSFDEHDAIVAALENRDRASARDAMRAHLQSTLGTMTEAN